LLGEGDAESDADRSPQEAARVPQVVFGVGPRQANHSPRHLPGDDDTAEPGCETAVRYTSTMPKIFEQDGYSFFFYSNDHAPIHVHVRRDGGEAVFVVEPEVELRESVGFNVRELSRAEDLIDDNIELIKQKWAEHLG